MLYVYNIILKKKKEKKNTHIHTNRKQCTKEVLGALGITRDINAFVLCFKGNIF